MFSIDMQKNIYDLIIVGAGPAGLAVAHCCSALNLRILVIDKEQSIGGCHRVKRVNNIFTEHGPRIYLSIYKNMFDLLSEIGLSSDDIFTDYLYSTFSLIRNKVLPYLTIGEIISFIGAYLRYILDENYGSYISLKQFCVDNGYSEIAIEMFDRICRLTDGSTIEGFSLNNMLTLADTNVSGLQPKGPLDKILFNKWQDFLEKRGVHFSLGHTIKSIHYNSKQNNVDYIILDNNVLHYTKNLVLAVPPVSLTKLLEYQTPLIKNCFANYNVLKEWSEKTEYIEYISITYHFKKDIYIPKVHGLSMNSEWGIVIVNLSDYMQDIENEYAKVISLAITICDKPSKYTNKTANQCSNRNELMKEAYRQLKSDLFPDLPHYDLAVLNPNNYYDSHAEKWQTTDEAFFHSVNTNYLPFHSTFIRNIYNVGTHNGHHHINLTTMESAVTNGIVLSGRMYPQLKRKIKTNWKYRDIIIYIIIMLLVIILIVLIAHNYN